MNINPSKETGSGCERKGTWLEAFCPDDSCLSEEERIKLKAFCDDSEKKRDLWRDTFCPEDSCDVSETSQLP